MDAYIGEIRIFAGLYAPEDWAYCDGSKLTIANNEALYSLIGTTYGGDGVANFGLPDLRGRLPLGIGQGPGLSAHTIGQTGGTEAVTLSEAQLPVHAHALNASTATSTTTTVGPTVTFATPTGGCTFYTNPPSKDPAKQATLSSRTCGFSGSNGAYDNRMPYLSMNYIICLRGNYPNFD